MLATLRLGKGIGNSLVAVFIGPCLMAQTSIGTADRAQLVPPLVQPSTLQYTPLTEKERLQYYWQHMFSLESVVRAAAGAGINQMVNTPHEWGQGAEGYGYRFASNYTEHIIQSTVMYGASVALHEDNRYFRSGQSAFGARMKYAIASTFMARHDDGTRHVSFSRLSSYAAAAVLSRAWQPPSTSGPVHAADNFAIFVGVEAGFNVAREFLPGIFHSHAAVAAGANPAP
jgi:hypothetical protein